MKRDGIFINTARGGIIDDMSCVLKALQSGHLSFAGLDVIPDEPPVYQPYYPEMLSLMSQGRLVINPHTAYYSEQSFEEMRTLAAVNIFNAVTTGKIRNEIMSCDS